MKKHRWCARDLNQGPLDGRHRRIQFSDTSPYEVMEYPLKIPSIYEC